LDISSAAKCGGEHPFFGHDINDAVFPLVKNDLPVIKRGLLENPPCVVDFPRDTSFSRGFPS